MRHRKKRKTLGMDGARRKAAIRGMASALIEHGKVETTLLRAKVLRDFIEPLITAGKKQDLASRRLVLRRLPNKQAVKRLFDDVAPVFADRPGGYTRILRTGKRRGDNASMAIIEFVDEIKKAPAAAAE